MYYFFHLLHHVLLEEQKYYACSYRLTFSSCINAFHAHCTHSYPVLDVFKSDTILFALLVCGNPLDIVSPLAHQSLVYLTYNWTTCTVSSTCKL